MLVVGRARRYVVVPEAVKWVTLWRLSAVNFTEENGTGVVATYTSAGADVTWDAIGCGHGRSFSISGGMLELHFPAGLRQSQADADTVTTCTW